MSSFMQMSNNNMQFQQMQMMGQQQQIQMMGHQQQQHQQIFQQQQQQMKGQSKREIETLKPGGVVRQESTILTNLIGDIPEVDVPEIDLQIPDIELPELDLN